jgi:hypothetical protein
VVGFPFGQEPDFRIGSQFEHAVEIVHPFVHSSSSGKRGKF